MSPMAAPRHVLVALSAVLSVALLAAGCGDDEPRAARPRPGTEEGQPAGAAVTVTLTPVAELEFVTGGTPAADVPEELYLSERAGTIRLLRADGNVSDPLLDLRDETLTDDEQGLLDVVTDADREWLYFSYTDLEGDLRLERAPIEEQGALGEREELFEVPQPETHHNGGGLAVGPDGNIYVGIGDGGGWGRDWQAAGQDVTRVLATIVRLRPDGSAPDDNPFADGSGAPEVWVYGLRNPWRISFDRETGDLWIADVGWGEREEINLLPANEQEGANMGWPCWEGTLDHGDCEAPGHVPPVFDYGRPPGCAVTGGYRYRGSAIPDLEGAYVYSDYCDGTIRALDVDEEGAVDGSWSLEADGGQVVSFAEDAAGELYVLSAEGTVARLDPP
jgi:glucose/arabinose dehydrogenase